MPTERMSALTLDLILLRRSPGDVLRDRFASILFESALRCRDLVKGALGRDRVSMCARNRSQIETAMPKAEHTTGRAGNDYGADADLACHPTVQRAGAAISHEREIAGIEPRSVGRP